MNIIFFVKRFYTNKDLIDDKFGRLFHIPVNLFLKGHVCTVYCLDFKTREKIDRTINGVQFVNLPVRSFSCIKNIKRLLSRVSIDIIFCSGDSYIGYIGHLLAKRYKAKLFFDVYDDYSTFASNKLPFMKAMLKASIKKSDLFIAASQAIENKYKIYSTNSIILGNGIDPSVFKPMDMMECRKALGLNKDAKIIGYFGSIHEDRGIHVLIAAMNHVRKKYPAAALLLSGANQSGIDLTETWMDYRGMLPQEKVVALINACDVVTIPYLNTEHMQMTNACKLSEYLACSRPIVVSDIEGYAQIFSDNKKYIGISGDAKSLASAIDCQIKDQFILPQSDDHSWERLINKMEYYI